MGDPSALIWDYCESAFRYGAEYHDERAGDELYHNTLRNLIAAVIKREPVIERLAFMEHTGDDDRSVLCGLLPEAKSTVSRFDDLDEACALMYPDQSHPEFHFFWQSLWMPTRFLRLSATAFVHSIEALVAFIDEDFESAFRRFSRASVLLGEARQALESTAAGRWTGFYRGEWLVDVRETQRVVRTMQGLTRIHGDTDHWLSPWTIKAFQLDTSLMSPLRQASAGYDSLGRALDAFHEGNQLDVADLIEGSDRQIPEP